jgi:farnesyl-diphosphate farnesyltransferase
MSTKPQAAKLEDLFANADPDQIAMMAEEVILVDRTDKVLGHASKKITHLNENIEQGMLHRAFSVFMFRKDGRLLMQKRSSDKITFPNYWANTCCSHPLFVADELEQGEPKGRYVPCNGVKTAARRKLFQELGINPEDIPMGCFEFVTRVYYKATSDETWGEHEMDYILVCRPPNDVEVRPNPNEVAEIRWFDMDELKDFVVNSHENGDLVSPWFRIIWSNVLSQMWTSVLKNESPTTHVDPSKIYEASNVVTLGASQPKVPVPVFTDSWTTQVMQFDEVWSLVKLKLLVGSSTRAVEDLEDEDAVSDFEFCDFMLKKTSRSFAMVIAQLPHEDNLRNSVMLFYLILRGLDTVEDDMDYASPNMKNADMKIEILRSFHKLLGSNNDTKLEGIGCNENELKLMNQFHRIRSEYQKLSPTQREVIEDITKRMGNGMADYVHRDLTQGTRDGADFDLYCHYVAGLVGEGLTKLFVASGHEDEAFLNMMEEADSLGKFLQKTNIIRDFREDLEDGRTFWPKSVWSKYAPEDLFEFREEKNREKAVECMNELIAETLAYVPHIIEYLGKLKNPEIFRFCAIPQVMAIATLDKCYNNPLVMQGVVKLRRGTTAKLMLNTNQTVDVKKTFRDFCSSIQIKSNSAKAGESVTKTTAALNNVFTELQTQTC